MGLHFIATAQNLTVSGSVTDQGGYPLEGATVLVKGTANGTVTDAEGNYRISASGDSELIVSYLGYLSQVKSVNGGTKVDFVLQEEMPASPAQWVCTVCGYVLEPAKNHVHTMKQIPGKAATCTQAGSKTQSCVSCGATLDSITLDFIPEEERRV